MTEDVNFVSFDVLILFKGRLIQSDEVCTMSSVGSLRTLQQLQYCPQWIFFSFDCTVLEEAVGSQSRSSSQVLEKKNHVH